VSRSERGAAEEVGDPAASGHVELQAVHGARRNERGRIGQRPAVLAGRHVRPDLPPDRGQPGEVLRGHRLLEPGHAKGVQLGGDPYRLPRGITAVGVDVQLGARADHLAREPDASQVAALVAAPRLADLDLHPRNLLFIRPPAELVPGALVGVAGEPAAAVHRNGIAGPAEQVGQGHAEQSRLEVP
jgi:hypothetical protein